MKKLFLSALMLLCIACGEKKQQPEVVTVEEGASSEDTSMTVTPAERTAQIKDTTIAQLYDAYSNLKNALVNADTEEAKAAGQMLDNLTKVNKISDSSLNEAVAEIIHTDNIDLQREQLPVITASLKNLLDGEIASGTLYYQYCPMAFSGKGGHWISNDKKIYNPYFGSKMMTCGTIEQELN